MKTYQETEKFLFERLPMFQRIGGAAYKKDLSNTIALLNLLDNPERKNKYLHVAGTNGKGSTASMLAAILTSAGYKVGLYTSPHLKHFNERIRVNGVPIPEDRIVAYVNEYVPLIEEIKPSFFELTTAMAFQYFADSEVDIAVMEVGLGGRLDSTNVIKPLVSVITQIGLDHQEFLGDTVEEIATEKAGIIKYEVPVVTSVPEENLNKLIQKIAFDKNAPFYYAADDYKITSLGFSDGYNQYEVLNLKMQSKQVISSDLGGIYQAYNIMTVLSTIAILRDEYGMVIDEKAVLIGLKNVKNLSGLRGRWQKFKSKLTEAKIIADTGHNESAVKLIVQMLLEEKYDQLHIIWGAVKDKDIDKIMALLPAEATYYFTKASVPRALETDELSRIASKFNLKGQNYASVSTAFQAAIANSHKNDLIFVGGSTFIVAELPILD
jgi:dihydrofolate synthase/folylpolyglutamate synthase